MRNTNEENQMSRSRAQAICTVAILLGACTQQSEPGAASGSGSRVSEDTVFKAQVHALKKAEDVQKILNEAAARQREAIEKQSQ
jgi:hypothetical protein